MSSGSFSFDDFGSGDGLETHVITCDYWSMHGSVVHYLWFCVQDMIVHWWIGGYQIWLQGFEVMFVHEKLHLTGYPLLHQCDTKPSHQYLLGIRF